MSETPVPKSRPSWGTRIVLVLFAAVAVPLGATLLYTYAPTEYTFYPRCMFRVTTGLNCPGCGMTRCLAALLHGNLAQAFAYNPLFVVLLPAITYGLYTIAYQMWTGRRAPGPSAPVWMMRGLVVVLLAYWVARNIDVFPLNLLAPHELLE